ncbi:NAD(P)/FAD-dependent oxidoreductase [Nocardioides sp. JQ2195]|uniref:phytoene desaturase family protein n=1 Tax=Nocardioides sp. JQ2195 TaxID=2592334 RepID=UPI00143E54FA|nr:NAD(P)/FAD-dependent oxidoreductase [Nocardioides sp. JQ2195]QIX26032.1 NAD(P)/FAD-dependent oxidoreductase [Nocardioides sp. JQ2195]
MTPATSPSRSSYDVVIVGGGHNGLTAAAYLARAGLSTLLLERLPATGGAAVSKVAFTGHDARLSRYSYLVSLMPKELVTDLDLSLDLASRTTASYTPWLRDGVAGGLLAERPEGSRTRESFEKLTGSNDEYAAWQQFYGDVAKLAAVVSPTLLQPLEKESDIASRVDPDLWREFVREPLGASVERRFRDDTVRGIVATDGLIGTFADLNDPSLVQNRCFLYHLIGNGDGEWRVPIGGMGAVTDALLKAAVEAGAEVITGAGVSRIEADGVDGEVTWHDGTAYRSVRTRHVLSNVAPWVLRILLGQEPDEESKPVGAQLKINFLLDRLPALRSGADPEVAFAGTLHLSEDYSQLQRSYAEAAAGRVPTEMPGEVYCHSLSDRSIMGSFPGHTLTYFGLHTPATLFEDPANKDVAVSRALASLNQHLAEPIEDCLAKDADGRPCIEAKVPQDIEADLAMPGGHIFHGDLAWPWAANRSMLETPAQQWGVATDIDNLYLCGSGARRGGAVSGLGGHNAAQAVLAAVR